MSLGRGKAVAAFVRKDRKKQSYIRRYNRDPRKRNSPLYQQRLELGLTQEELAQETGLHVATIKRIEAGKLCKVASLKKLSEFFDTPWHQLVACLDQIA